MALVRVEGALAVGDAPAEGKDCVGEGQGQRQHGHEEGEHGVELEQAHNGGGGQNEAQQLGAHVPHEYLGRVHVVGHKAQTGPGEGYQDDGDHRLRHQQGDYQHRGGAYGGHAHRQPVQAVYQVHGVGATHYPYYGKGDGQMADVNSSLLRKDVGVGDGVEDQAGAYGDYCRQQLGGQLCPGVEVYYIVHGAHHRYYNSAHQKAHDLGGHIHKEQQTYYKAKENGQAAHTGNGVVVDSAAVFRHIHCSHLFGKFLYRRGHKEGYRKSHYEGQQHFEPIFNIWNHQIFSCPVGLNWN